MSAVGALIEALKNEDADLRRRAADALAKMSRESLTAGLVKALSQEDTFTRLKVTLVIDYYTNDPQVLDELARLVATDQSEEVRSAAIEALEKSLVHQRLLGSDSDVISRARERINSIKPP